MDIKRLALLGGLCVTCAGPALAADLPDGEVRFERISVRDGLSQSTIFSIVQDQHGFLWFATEDGLNKYDGYRFVHYRHRAYDPGSISRNWVSVVLEDHQGTLWLATRRGLDRLDRQSGQFRHFPFPDSEREVWCLREDSRGNLWLGTNYGLERFDRQRGTFRHYSVAPAHRGAEVAVYDLLEDHAGGLWLATWGSGLLRLDRTGAVIETFRVFPGGSEELGSDRVRVLHKDQRGDFWVGTAQGLFRFHWEARRFEPFVLTGAGEPLEVTSLLEDKSGTLWVGTLGNGVYVLSPDRARQVSLRHQPGNLYSLSHDLPVAKLIP